MSRNYWLDLFTGKTWEEFLRNGANVSGFRLRRRKTALRIKPGDYLLCYVTKISRFIGVLEVTSVSFVDTNKRIWEDDLFPIRFNVKLVTKLDPQYAIPLHVVTKDLSKFQKLNTVNAWGGFLRGSPVLFHPNDAQVIISAINGAIKNPVYREYDRIKYWKNIKPEKLQLPKNELQIQEPSAEYEQVTNDVGRTTHEEIQWTLLKLGSDLGLKIWAAKNDRNKEFNGNLFQNIPDLLSILPIQINEKITKIIERIDVLWLKDDAIIAAFEIEHTTQIYSGLLRMSDLVTMLPSITIKLFIVAPDERRQDVLNEIRRPTFSRGLVRPLSENCRFISYTSLKQEIEAYGPRIKRIQPDFLDDIAESC